MMDSKQKAEELVNGIRQSDYGHPKVNMKRIASIWSGVLDMEVTPEQVALCMAGLKLARLVHSPNHEDTQVDLMGYIAVLQRLLDPEDLPGTSTIKVSYKRAVPEVPATPTDGKVYVDGELWGYMKNGVFRMKPKTAPWEPGPYELKPEDGPTITFTEPTAFTASYPDGSKDMTFEEAVGEAGPPKFYGSGRNPCGQ